MTWPKQNSHAMAKVYALTRRYAIFIGLLLGLISSAFALANLNYLQNLSRKMKAAIVLLPMLIGILFAASGSVACYLLIGCSPRSANFKGIDIDLEISAAARRSIFNNILSIIYILSSNICMIVGGYIPTSLVITFALMG
jgi:multisubunit Na+/H+ antiporter MnhE subunit